PEQGLIVTYRDWGATLPWSTPTGGTIDIARARQVLDEDHYDLEKIKDRILEYLAVKKLREERAARLDGAAPAQPPHVTGDSPPREPILCFVGPPGVAKTSLAQTIAPPPAPTFAPLPLRGF